MKWILPIVILLVIIQVMFSPLFVVHETEQAIILQLGEHKRTINEAGLHFKLPAPIQNVIFFDKRVLEYDAAPAEIITKDKKTMIIDNYARWKISDPIGFYTSVKNFNSAQARLDDIVYSDLRESLGKHEMAEIISEKRDELMDKVTQKSRKKALDYGIEIIDVRIKRADLPPENAKSIYERMKAERRRKANMYRSEGEEEAMKIRATTDKEKTIILAEAKAVSEKISGEGDALATKMYAEAFKKDPYFYQFIKTMDAYKTALDSQTTIILPLKNDFLKFLSSPQGD